jgi:hypothetical protein
LTIKNLFQSVTKKEGRPNPGDDKKTLLSELSKIFAGTIVDKEILKRPSADFEAKMKLLITAKYLGTGLSEEQMLQFQDIKSRNQLRTVTDNLPKCEEEDKTLLEELSKLFAGSIVDKEVLKKPLKFEEKMKKLVEAKNLGTGWSEEQKVQFDNIESRYNLIKLELAGPEEEEKVFDKLRSALEKLSIKDTVLISGWNIAFPKEDRCEFDFLIVSEPMKTVFQIEVKLTQNASNRKDGGEQLMKGLKICQARIPFPKQENWNYVQAMFFAFNKKGQYFNSHCDRHQSVTDHQCHSQFCKECQAYILGPETDLSAWWEQMTSSLTNKEYQSPSTPLNRNIYKQTIQFLTRQMYIQEDCFTKQNLLDYTEEKIEKISTPEKLFFWSKGQYPLFNDSRNKRMVFISHFGTGKTTLLKAMSRQLLQRGEKVVFIFWENESLLQKNYRNEFKVFKDQIQMVLLKCRGEQKFNLFKSINLYDVLF